MINPRLSISVLADHSIADDQRRDVNSGYFNRSFWHFVSFHGDVLFSTGIENKRVVALRNADGFTLFEKDGICACSVAPVDAIVLLQIAGKPIWWIILLFI